jgi:hypothetical protein
MCKVSVLLLIKDDYPNSIFSFESSGFTKQIREEEFYIKEEEKTIISTINGIEVELVVGIQSDADERAWNYFKDVADIVYYLDKIQSEAEAYNLLFRQCTSDYVCIYKFNVFLEKNWLNDLLFFAENIEKAGVVGISNNILDAYYLPIISKDQEKLVNVFIPENEILASGLVTLFDRQHLYNIGAFDEAEDMIGLEYEQFQMRSSKMGYNNFYIPTQSCISLNNAPVVPPERLKIVINKVEEMRKNNNFYIPLDRF